MEISHYMFAFFIKRNKWEIEKMNERLRQVEISDAGQTKDLEHLTKLAEDRREDVKNLFKRLEDK